MTNHLLQRGGVKSVEARHRSQCSLTKSDIGIAFDASARASPPRVRATDFFAVRVSPSRLASDDEWDRCFSDAWDGEYPGGR